MNHPRYFLSGVKRFKPPETEVGPELGVIKQAAADMSRASLGHIRHFMDLKNTSARVLRTMTPPSEGGLVSLKELLDRMGH